MSIDTLRYLAPELVIVAMAVALYSTGTLEISRRFEKWTAAAGIVTAGLLLAVQANVGPLANDELAVFGRWFALTVGLALVLIVDEHRSTTKPAYYGSLLLAVVGLMLVAAARGLAMLFVGLEMVMLPVYVMLFIDRRNDSSVEIVIKHFFLGMLASVLFVYGLSFLYGMAGSTDLGDIRATLAGTDSNSSTALAGIALVLVVVSLGLRVVAVPFFFDLSDAYRDTANPNAALLAVIPKAVGFFILMRLIVGAMPCVAPDACWLIMLLAVPCMTAANVMALRQDRLNRVLAYSSLAYTGYFLVAISVALATEGKSMCWAPLAALLFSLVTFALAILGLFAALACLRRCGQQVDHVEELAGLARTHPTIAASISISLLSLACLPPLAGFWGQLAIFAGAFEVGMMPDNIASVPRTWFLVLVVVGVLNMALMAAYYLRIIGVIYFRLPLGVLRTENGRVNRAIAVVCALAVVGIGLYTGPLWHWILEASRSITIAPF